MRQYPKNTTWNLHVHVPNAGTQTLLHVNTKIQQAVSCQYVHTLNTCTYFECQLLHHACTCTLCTCTHSVH